MSLGADKMHCVLGQVRPSLTPELRLPHELSPPWAGAGAPGHRAAGSQGWAQARHAGVLESPFPSADSLTAGF